MKFILFGAGDIGLRALGIIGEKYVECFADNKKHGIKIHEKNVISFEEMISRKDAIIVITSNNYASELAAQLDEAGISDYIIFNRRYREEMNPFLPKYNYLYNTQYMNYTDILLNYDITFYKKIVVVGVNKYLRNLLLEIAVISNLDRVGAIVGEEGITDYFGIPNIKLDDIDESYDCIMINVPRSESNIRDLDIVKEKAVVDIYDVDKFIYYNIHPELKKYKDMHRGRRIFIVGNGPSVRIEDLETIRKHNEISFGMNRIHKIFEKTSWRPDYICMTDSRVIISCEKDLDIITENSRLIVGDRYQYTNNSYDNIIDYVHLKSEYYAPNLPGFSEDITQGVFWGFTVTYDIAIQFAAYMGAKEIYLIGIDNNNVGEVTDKRNHFIDNYFEPGEEETYKNVVANFEAMNIAYEKAERYSREHGFRIYNATRGGKLEVFERVDFDSLF